MLSVGMDDEAIGSNGWQAKDLFARIIKFGTRWLVPLLGSILIFFLPVSTVWSDTPDHLILERPVTMDEIIPHVSYYMDPEWKHSISDMTGADTHLFSPLESSAISFGYTRSKVWLMFDVRNLTDSDRDWLIHFRENFVQVFDVYIVRADGTLENSLSLQRDSAFSERPVSYPELVAPLTLNQGEVATILISYWSEGFSGLEFSLETTDSFAEISARRTAKNYVYYGMMIIMIVAAAIFLMVLRESVFVAYLAYAVSTLLYLMHADGVAFQFLWPALPLFNSYASILIGGSFALLCANFARVYLQTRVHHPFVNKVLLMVILTVALVMIVGTYVDAQWTKKTLIWLALLSIATCTWSGIVAAFSRFRQVRFYVFAWIGAIVSSMIMNMRHIFGIDIAQDLEFDSMRIAMVFDALMMGFGIADRYSQLRKSSQLAMEKNLAMAEHHVNMNKRLQDLQDQYHLATELVQSRDADLIKTVHDIRQPLHALRLNVRRLSETPSSGDDDNRQIEDTFAYLEKLIAGHLMQTIEPAAGQYGAPGAGAVIFDSDEPVTVPSILRSIHEMFLPDATEKGLKFRYRSTHYDADVNHLALMRIISNLVSNAIKHTSSGGVLLGCRKRPQSLKIEVHDTGPGLPAHVFETILGDTEQHVDGQRSADGHGYGLSITGELASKHNLRLYRCQGRSSGTGIGLEIPISDEGRRR